MRRSDKDARVKDKGAPQRPMAMLSEILEENKSERLSDKSKSDKRQPSDQSDSSSKKQKDQVKPRFNDLDDVQVVDPSIKPMRDNMEESK